MRLQHYDERARKTLTLSSTFSTFEPNEFEVILRRGGKCMAIHTFWFTVDAMGGLTPVHTTP